MSGMFLNLDFEIAGFNVKDVSIHERIVDGLRFPKMTLTMRSFYKFEYIASLDCNYYFNFYCHRYCYDLYAFKDELNLSTKSYSIRIPISYSTENSYINSLKWREIDKDMCNDDSFARFFEEVKSYMYQI